MSTANLQEQLLRIHLALSGSKTTFGNIWNAIFEFFYSKFDHEQKTHEKGLFLTQLNTKRHYISESNLFP